MENSYQPYRITEEYLVAVAPIQEGTLIHSARPTRFTNYQTARTFQLAPGWYAELDHPSPFFQHGCEWNVGLRNNLNGGYDFVAARKICPGERLVRHFGMSDLEYQLSQPCACSATFCYGTVQGFNQLEHQRQKQLIDAGAGYHIRYQHQLALRERNRNASELQQRKTKSRGTPIYQVSDPFGEVYPISTQREIP